jgi:hypothetical protein
MTDTVNSNVTADGRRNYVIHLQGKSDGTGESAVLKVDISTLTGPAGKAGLAPTYFAAKSVDYNISSGFESIQLLFDATTDDEMVTLAPGSGYLPFDPPLNDPRSTGTTGDILLTSNGATNGATYDIVLHLIKKD